MFRAKGFFRYESTALGLGADAVRERRVVKFDAARGVFGNDDLLHIDVDASRKRLCVGPR